MKILAIDTSCKFLSVAVTDGDRILSSYHRQAHMNHSSRLIPAIAAILKKAGLHLRDIDGFAVSIGPGSFTGLRIGVTAIKALAFSLKKRVVAVSTLDAIAENARHFIGTICPILDAKKGKVYASFYKSNGKSIKGISDYLLLQPDELAKKIKTVERILFLGDGVDIYKDKINKGDGRVEFYDKSWQPRARVIAQLAIEKFRRRRFSNVSNLAPLYLYSRECDIKGW